MRCVTPREARGLFPGLADKTFLDAACVSLAPRPAVEAIAAFTEMALRCDAPDASRHHVAMDRLVGPAREQAARLLGCPARQVALIESTSHGLNLAAGAIPLRAGDNVLVADTEFLQVAIPWAKRAEAGGLELRPVASRQGLLRAEDFEAAIDARTRVVCVSSVQWSSGCRVDLRRLGEICRARGAWLVVDAVQELGALRFDPSPADFVVAGGHKWLNAPFGCGLMYVGERALRELEPASWGYLGLEVPAGGWQAYFETPDTTPFRPYPFRRGARRFETGGTTNYPGAVGLAASLGIVNGIGIAEVERHVRGLAELARVELLKAGARIVSPEPEWARSAITVFRCFEDPRQDRALLESLLAGRIYVAVRYTSQVGGIRVSTHYFNYSYAVLVRPPAFWRALGGLLM
jgi:selenocysteine lyase/cysteine desulfurase